MDGIVSLLALADSRLPAGGHAHSGGIEPAMAAGLVRDLDDLGIFLRGRVRSAGLVAAGIAAAVAHRCATADAGFWGLIDAETDARTASPAQRDASRQQGRALLRAGRAAWPAPYYDRLAATPAGPHHAVALGAVGAAAGGDPAGVAHVAGYLAISGPAAAAVRLRGFDPFAVHALLAVLTPEVEAVAAAALRSAAGPPPDLPCVTAPRLDLLAELHARSEVRLFAS